MDNPNTSYQLRVQSILPSINKKNEMKIYEFIEINRKEIIHMSVADAAEACGVSEAAIVRYAQKLGYKGYQAMKISIAQDVIEPGQQIYGQLSKGDTIPTIVDKIFDSNIQSLRDTSDVLSRENIDEAVNLILGCRRLLFFGVGGSGCVAMDMDIAKQSGAKTIAITNYGKSPIVEKADVVLYTSSNETAFNSDALSSRIAELTIIDMLYIGVSYKRYDESYANILKTRKALDSTKI